MHFSEQSPVEVDRGTLVVAYAGDGPAVLALHTTTGSHLSWDLLAAVVPEVHLIAPDLRGRGGSSDLSEPYGLDQHLADLRAVVDRAGARDFTVVGHGTGAALAVLLARALPARVGRVLLVEGGFAGGRSPEEVGYMGIPDLTPVERRLSASFTSREEYHGLAMRMPAFQHWTPEIKEYIDYDLVDSPPRIRCRTKFDAIAADAADLTARASDVTSALRALQIPIMFLCAERGIQGESTPTFDSGAVAAFAGEVESMTWHRVTETDHYAVLNTERGAKHTAAVLYELLGRAS